MQADTQSSGGAAVESPLPQPLKVRLGNFLFRFRNGIGPIAFLLALATAQPMNPLGRPDLGALLAAMGVLVALAGAGVRIFTIGFEYIERGGRNRQVYASKLVVGGVFDHCRNPLYVGNILICVGLALVANSPIFYGLIPCVLLAYMLIVSAEEAYLRNKFGLDYTAYCARVGRWWPRMNGWAASLQGLHFNWGRVLVKEYNTGLLLLLSLGVLLLWRQYRIGGTSALPPHPAIAGALGTWMAIYLLARWLKKSGVVKD
ncbi:isoprenylcysteine carboxylmethyltransferase family protein [Ramlibacter sp. XY19]|uniref:methyltransferase family protein n=1 Tax=Ramlibacter paludis TaxID=2908000 RepID=UPI0023DB5264|nr:isoprenylcysteine carboxylmethyltransferase family protein [Ramlibacter paludis]MCG2591639.1 isoprenylcysteine carboxylmethyltransferase family protein [Ramlibacter paludis]